MKRDLGHIDLLMQQEDIKFSEKQLQRIQTIRELYEQQDYMYRNNVPKNVVAYIRYRWLSGTPPSSENQALREFTVSVIIDTELFIF